MSADADPDRRPVSPPGGPTAPAGRVFTMISPYPPSRTGPAEYCQVFATEMARRGHKVTILTEALADPAEAAHLPADPPGVEVRRVFHRGLRQGKEILRAAERTEGEVVYLDYSFTMYGSGLTGALTFRAFRRLARRRPVVVMLFDILPRTELTRETLDLYSIRVPPFVARAATTRMLRSIGRWAARVVVQTGATEELLVRDYGVPVEKIQVTELPAYPPIETALPPPSSGRPSGWKNVLFYGYLAPYKGVEVLLEAFRAARKGPGGDRLRLVVAGTTHTRLTSDYRETLIERARSLGLAPEQVSFPGYVEPDEAARLFASSDLVVLPYLRTTGASGALATALGMRRPVVITSLPPIVHQLNGYPAGRVVPPGESAPLARAMLDMAGGRFPSASTSVPLHPSWDDLARTTRAAFAAAIRTWSGGRGPAISLPTGASTDGGASPTPGP